MLRHHALPAIEDDTEDAPWMVMSEWQFNAVDVFHDVLVAFLRSRGSQLFVGAMMPIRFRPDAERGDVRQLAPDVFVSSVNLTGFGSYNLDHMGQPPAF